MFRKSLVLVLSCMIAAPASTAETDVRAALDAFIEAFENGDTDAMRTAFADDAVTFPRTVMGGRRDEPIETERYRRVSGLDPQMIEILEQRRAEGASPPLLRIEPRDVDIRVFGDVALVTFHLGGADSLGRRTFVMVRRESAWKILHLHASSVVARD